MTKHKRECRRICEQAGLDVMGVETRRGGHVAVHTAQGLLFCPGTPGDRRWRWNARAMARRMANATH